MKTLLATTALAAALTLGAGNALAVPFNTTYAITAYHGDHLSGGDTGPGLQALPSAIPFLTNVGSFTYTGALNFFEANPSSLAAFIGTGGGTVTGDIPKVPVLSTGNSHDATLLKLTFTVAAPQAGTVTNDDGVSIYRTGNTTDDLLPISASGPTGAVANRLTLAAGTYDLYYSEVDGAPAQLTLDLTRVPEPASMALLGAGLLGLGLVRRTGRSS